MLCMEFKVFHVNFLLLEGGVRVLVCNFENFLVKLKNYIPVAANAEKIFEMIKINFHVF